MRAFWCVRGSDGEGPDFPVELDRNIVNGDLRNVQPDIAPADHRHTTIGSLAIGPDHYHWFYIWNDTIYQDYVGNVANEHTHNFPLDPTHFLVWVLCTDQQYTDLLTAIPNLTILGENEIIPGENDDPDTIGSVDNTTWDAGTRTDWENLVDNFGLELPEQIINDRRLVQWSLQTWNARGQKMVNERNYRLGVIP